MIEIVLGKDAYNLIKKSEYSGTELTFYELSDICQFLLEEINDYNKKFQNIIKKSRINIKNNEYFN